MYGLAEFVKIIHHKSWVHNLILILNIAFNVSDKVILVELDLLFFLNNIRGWLVLLSDFMVVAHFLSSFKF